MLGVYWWVFKRQLHAVNLKCVNSHSDALLPADRISNQYFLAVGQVDVPSACVLLSTCATVRCNMKSWILSGNSDQWRVELKVRDLGGHLDTTLRDRAGTLAGRIEQEVV